MTKLRVNMASESDVSVQGHGVHTAYVELAAGLEKRKDIELVRGEFWKRPPVDVVHLHTIGPRVWPKITQPGVARVVSAHVVPDSFVGSLVGAKFWYPFAAWYLRWFYGRADLLLAVSETTKRNLEDFGVKAPIKVLHNGINTEQYKKPTVSRAQMRKKLNIPKDAFVVIGAGQVQPRKRIDSFVAAAKALPDVHFVWVGGMPFKGLAASRHEMERLMATDLSNVHFTGIVELETMVNYYHAADLFWLPSEQETFGLVVVEAAASGLPILLRESDDYLYTFASDAYYGSDETFAKKITKLRDDAKLRKQMQGGAKKIAERYDATTIADQLVGYYKEVLKK